MVEAGGVGIFRALKTRKLLILLDAQNSRNAEIAPNWNVSGTRENYYSAFSCCLSSSSTASSHLHEARPQSVIRS